MNSSQTPSRSASAALAFLSPAEAGERPVTAKSADRERPQRRARRALEADGSRDEQKFVGAFGRKLFERHVLDVEDAVLHHQLLVHRYDEPGRARRNLVRRRVAAGNGDLALDEPA